MARRSRRSRPSPKRHYKRTQRLSPLFQQAVAEYLERVDDDRFGLLTVTGADVDADLNKATIFVSSLDADLTDASDRDIERNDAVLDALEEHRKRIQAELGRTIRLRKTPEVLFAFDPAVRAGAKIDQILRQLDGDEAN